MDFERVDMRQMSDDEMIEAVKMSEIVFKLNHTLPNTEEYNNLLKELFGDNLGENSQIMAPISGAAFDRIKIGDNAVIGTNAVVLDDVPERAIVVGSPARIVGYVGNKR